MDILCTHKNFLMDILCTHKKGKGRKLVYALLSKKPPM